GVTAEVVDAGVRGDEDLVAGAVGEEVAAVEVVAGGGVPVEGEVVGSVVPVLQRERYLSARRRDKDALVEVISLGDERQPGLRRFAGHLRGVGGEVDIPAFAAG